MPNKTVTIFWYSMLYSLIDKLNKCYGGIIYLKSSFCLKIRQQISLQDVHIQHTDALNPRRFKIVLGKRENIKSHITVKFNVTIFVCDSIQKNTKVYGPLSQSKHNKVRRMRRPSQTFKIKL